MGCTNFCPVVLYNDGMEDKKTSIFAVLKILEKYSDEDHILTKGAILDLVESEYGINIERRTLYTNINMLKDFGYDISDYKDNKTGYYLRDRQFEKSEILYLCNEIHASKFIPSAMSKDLIKKLLDTQNKYFKSDYTDKVYLDTEKKDNQQLFLNIELISSAIKNKEVISFEYVKYNLNKELVKTREKPYIRSPYYLVVREDRVYMVSKSRNHDGFDHYRLDRMKNIKTVNEQYINIETDDPYVYAKYKLFMFSGEDTNIILKCKNEIIDQMIDTFGKSVHIVPNDDGTFLLYGKCGIKDIKMLALSNLNNMEVIEPVCVREEIKEIINGAIKRYDK